MSAAERAGGYLGANLAFKLGKISEFQLSQALETIRNGNPRDWGNRINQIRRIQEAAKKGIKSRIVQSNQLPFTGGQADGVLYIVTLGGNNGQTDTKTVFGPVGGSINDFRVEPPGYTNDFQIVCRGFFVGGMQGNNFGTPQELKGYSYGFAGSFDPTPMPAGTIVSVRRYDGSPEETIPISTTTQTRQIVPTTNNTYITNNYQTPKTTDQIPEINKAKPNILTIPANAPIKISDSDKSITIAPATTSPSKVEIPHPRTIPSEPDDEKKVPPLSITNPGSPSVKLETSGSGPVTINLPGYNPITVNPGTNKPQGALPIQDINRQYQPVATPSAPTNPGTTPTTTPTPTTTNPPATKDNLEQFRKDIERLITTGSVLAGLTPAIQSIGEKVNKIGENTTLESLTTAAAAGTCRTTQPGGCTTKALDDAANKINQNTNDKLRGLDAAAQLEQLNLLNIIDGKLGAQVPGGISGFLQSAFRATRLDKIINALTLITSLHNAAMLSRNLGQTLGDLTSQALATIGIKDEHDSPIDINGEIGKQVNNLISSILGAETWAGTKLAWNKANTIIASATAITYSVRSLFDSARQIAEWTAENTGKIGNALKKFRVVGENAYPFMPENVTATNAWALKIDRVRQGVDSLDDAASSLSSVLGDVQNIQQEYSQIKEQKDKFDENVKSLTPKAREDNKPVADAVKAGRDASKSPADAATVFRGEGETPNA